MMCIRKILAVSISSLALGCGDEPAMPVAQPVPVKGKITFRKSPLTSGKILFEATDGGRDAKGTIGPDGSFSLTTNQEGDGAITGVYRVVVQDSKPAVKVKKEPHVRIQDGQTDYLIELQ